MFYLVLFYIVVALIILNILFGKSNKRRGSSGGNDGWGSDGGDCSSGCGD